MTGSGAGITGRTDQFHFVYQRVTGDTTIMARVDGLMGAASDSRVGVMIRETLGADAVNAFSYVSNANVLGVSTRGTSGSQTTVTQWAQGRSPVWLAVRRAGSTITGFTSSDGVSWRTMHTATVAMGQQVFVGLALSARTNAQRAQAFVSRVSVASSLPNGQQSADIGAPSPAGGASFSNGTYTVRAGGSNIGLNADQFHYVYQTLSGDLDLVARVASVTSADAMSRAGVMVRASLSSSAAFAFTSLRATAGYGFEWRYTSGASASVTNGGSGTPAGWVRLTRRGQRFSAYRSSDGQSWTLVESMDVAMPTTVYVGLAATSARAGVSTTAAVTNFSVSNSVANAPPTVSLTSPTAGQSWAAPANITLAASASDPEGRLGRVEFYANGALIGSDTTAPYGVTWSNVGAGTHVVMARAFDADGGRADSASVSVTITSPQAPPPPALPRYVSFNASPDHATTRLTGYRLNIYSAGADPTRATAVATSDLGMPAPDAQSLIRVDRGSFFTTLPSGSYLATVSAYGPGGSTQALPPVSFTR